MLYGTGNGNRLPGLLLPVPLTLQQATVNPHLHQRLPNTHRQVWISLSWGPCSFLLGPGAHRVLLVPSRSLCFSVLWKFCNQISLKTLQARLQQYENQELPDVQVRFRKGKGTTDQITSICWIIEKTREFQKNIFCFTDYTKAVDCVDHNKLENS